MKIKYGMILAAGLGKRMNPITLKTPKPLIKIGNKNLLERSIQLLINHGVEEIVINVHYLAYQITDFIKSKKYKVKITISDEQNFLLGTGGGVLKAIKNYNEPFIVINPDTLWSNNYSSELKNLEDLYFKEKKTCLLLVNKDLSFDKSFNGDFNLNASIISRDNNNAYIFTGLQILNQGIFNSVNENIFSMNQVWNNLIKDNCLIGIQSKQKFLHLNTKKMYDKILDLNITD